MKFSPAMLRGTLCLAATLSFAFVSTAFAKAAEEEADQEVVQVIIDLLSEEDKDFRSLGLEQVRSGAKGPAATKLFAEQLPKLSAQAQVGLLSALADRGDPVARPKVLETFANNRDEAVRVAAIRAIGSLGDAEDLSLLIELLASSSKLQQATARRSLTRLLGADVSAKMAGALKQNPPGIQAILIQILAERRALDTIPILLASAVGNDATVRAAAMKALGQLADSGHVDGMVQAVLKAEPGR
ncbi:MAG: HEAT repeat domain-containing protein, partial [Planctomycetales bacterium]